MGFSLKRALAGAVAGGAHAVGQIADAHLREAAESRQREEAFARQKQLVEMQDEIAARREQRVADLKESKEDAKRQKVADFMKSGLTSLKEQGVDVGSAAGQRRIAELAIENGIPELGDKFFDNAIRMDQITSTTDLRKAEIAARAEVARMTRASRGGGSNEDKEYEKGLRLATLAGGRIKVPDREGNMKPFESGASYGASIYQTAIDKGLSPQEAVRFVEDAQIKISSNLRKKPGVDPDEEIGGVVKIAGAKLGWWDLESTKPPPATQPATTAATQQKPYSPGMFGAQSQRSGTNTGLLNKIPGEGNFR